jgi:hypothetical protein
MNNLDLKFCRMDGSTPGEERQQMIDVFNRDESFKIFLLSTKGSSRTDPKAVLLVIVVVFIETNAYILFLSVLRSFD